MVFLLQAMWNVMDLSLFKGSVVVCSSAVQSPRNVVIIISNILEKKDNLFVNKNVS